MVNISPYLTINDLKASAPEKAVTSRFAGIRKRMVREPEFKRQIHAIKSQIKPPNCLLQASGFTNIFIDISISY
jgi:hypothetical protein